MPDTTPVLPEFNPHNRAYHRFFDVLPHLDISVTIDSDTGRPLTFTITDPRSGDAFTVTVDNSLEMTDPHALLAVDRFGEVVAYGPFRDHPTAVANATPLAGTRRLRSVHTIPLHHPDTADLPGTGRRALDTDLVRRVAQGYPDARCCALLLLDRTPGIAELVGPFTDPTTAAMWHRPRPTAHAERFVVPLYRAPRIEGR
ncbi:hypothetical protein [Plantactinospora endophytica]|uniref:DUF2470 domain-containing protein n=1 Tax=Plantactinospora endophytica TaxID=673535 RepID=A0ABQ4DWX1_9ACTN|nr:hypothetical protein [Plantactinospora endophytica]GIG86945.1 hypothetical protein Pen02_18810 [Plantactinospora endophytica]